MKQSPYRVAELQVSYHPSKSRKPLIRSAKDAFKQIVDFYPTETIALQERMVVLYMSRSGRVIGVLSIICWRHNRYCC
jgi:hypothetical protein